MILTKDRPKTEMQQFIEFVNDKKNYSVGYNAKGEIISCETKDKKIIAWLNKMGFNELQS